jgi:glycosyltransferase involved in cell wall biosynthesis
MIAPALESAHAKPKPSRLIHESMDPSQPPTVSACVIARDEAARLPACLASVDFCGEIVVVDSGSTDATVEIAKACGARVVEQSWLGFPAQRNVALEHASGDWVLEIDADERITPALAREIVSFLAEPNDRVDMGALPLRNVFLGRALGPSAKYPEYRRRLLRRGRYRHDEHRTVHEALIPHGPVHPFTADLEHILAANIWEALGDSWRYARLEAGQMQVPLTFPSFVRGALLRPPVKFAYRLLIDGGWRDGWRGAVKIALDCAIDATVWGRHLLGRRGDRLGRSGVGEALHYGATNFRAGAPRIVGVACGRRAHARALTWLEAVGDTGGDVALLSDHAEETMAPGGVARESSRSSVRVRGLSARLDPLALIRSLDAEEQLRTIDAVVSFGTRAHLLLRVVPPSLRGTVRDIEESSDPRMVCEHLGMRLAPQTASGDGNQVLAN